jgi:hypothetical protein
VSRQRDDRKRNGRAQAWAPVCPRCGCRGRHFAPASLGEPGFYACEAFGRVPQSGESGAVCACHNTRGCSLGEGCSRDCDHLTDCVYGEVRDA